MRHRDGRMRPGLRNRGEVLDVRATVQEHHFDALLKVQERRSQKDYDMNPGRRNRTCINPPGR